MSDHFPCRLLVDTPQSGAWNMAVDEALLCESAESGIAHLRFYEWNKPTLSLGYFQKYADRSQHPASKSADCVRRQTGGGAILHDHELTYSLALPRNHLLAHDACSLYNTVHEVIAAVLSEDLPSTAIRFASCQPASQADPFLCFLRRSTGDILFSEGSQQTTTKDHKIVGSAQRRSRGAVLQHGSILLGRSVHGPELAGLSDLCDTKLTTTCLVSNLSTQLTQALELEVCERAYSERSRALARVLQDEKYGNRLWTQKS